MIVWNWVCMMSEKPNSERNEEHYSYANSKGLEKG